MNKEDMFVRLTRESGSHSGPLFKQTITESHQRVKLATEVKFHSDKQHARYTLFVLLAHFSLPPPPTVTGMRPGNYL